MRAAKAKPLENSCVKPVPDGAPGPPEEQSPHDEIDPSALRAAKADSVENSFVKPVPAGAPVPP